MQIRSSRQMLEVFDKDIKKEGLSDRGLAAKSGLSTGTVYSLRKRGGNMTTDTMFAIAKELGFKVRVEK